MARRKSKKNKESKGSPAWMATFSDLMSLLLTFFILLFSMSQISEDRFRQVAESLQAALSGSAAQGMLEHQGDSLLDDSPLDGFEEDELLEEMDVEPVEAEVEATDPNLIPEEVHELFQTVTEYLEEEGIESEVTITRDAEGVYVDIQEAVLFSPGSATITESGSATLGRLAGMFDLFDNEIIVEGFTDDVPMNTPQFPSNWELSVGRSTAVVRYLAETHGIAPERLSATGYGEYRPIVPNDSDENRAINRRVNLIIVHIEREEVNDGGE